MRSLCTRNIHSEKEKDGSLFIEKFHSTFEGALLRMKNAEAVPFSFPPLHKPIRRIAEL
jgi:hypothetical protein